MQTPFFGGTYQSLSPNAADDRCINLYPEVMETKQGKQIGAFYSTPGQRLALNLPNNGGGAVMGPVRGTRKLSVPNLLLVVYGNQVVTVSINNVVTFLGLLNTASGPVSLIDNGLQYAVFDGYQGFVWSAGTWAQIQGIPLFPTSATVQDGFGLVTIANTDQFYQSNLNDLTTWQGLSFTSADSEPSPCVGITSLFRQLWVFKQDTTEIWNNAGLNGFAFQRMQGAYVQVGALATFSITKSTDHVFWLGKSPEGDLSVYMNNGYAEQRISTHPVEYAILQYMTATQQGATDAIGFAYNQAGHRFYVVTFPGGDATWVYDLTSQLWHERGEYLNGIYHRWDPSCYAFFNNQHIVGSSTAAQLAVLDIGYPTDDLASFPPTNPKRPLRRWRATKQPVNAPVRYDSLRIDLQTGASLLPVPQPFGGFINMTGALGNQYVGNTVNYAYTVTARLPPYTVVVSSGALPTGLSINAAGVVTGTVTASGTFSWTLTAIDFYGNTVNLSDTATVYALTWWLTDATAHLWYNPTIGNWTGAVANTRSPNISLQTAFGGGGYIQPSPTVVIGGNNAAAVEQVTNLQQVGTVVTTVTTVDGTLPVSNNLKTYGGVLVLCVQSKPYYYTSVDNGTTWIQRATPSSLNVSDISRLPNGTWIAEIQNGGTGGMYYSTDPGAPVTWTLTGTGVSGNPSGRIAVGSSVAMKIDSANTPRTTTDGHTWTIGTATYPGIGSNTGDSSGTTFVFGSNNSASKLFRTTNNGTTWTTISIASATGCYGLRYFPLALTWVATFTDGLFYSIDDGVTWTKATLPAGVSTAAFPCLVYHSP